MEQMEPHRRVCGSFMHACERKHASNLCVAGHRQNGGEIHRHIELLRIDLRLLHRQVRAQPMAMRVAVAGSVRRLTVMRVAVVIAVMATTAIGVCIV